MNPSQTISFGERLAKLREETGLTQEQAAAELKKRGISVSMRALAGYERGERAPAEVKQASILKELSNIAGKDGDVSGEEGDDDLVKTNTSTYLKIVGPGGRVMARIDLVFYGTTKPYQLPLDIETDVE